MKFKKYVCEILKTAASVPFPCVFLSEEWSVLGVTGTQVLGSNRRAEGPSYDLSRRTFPLVYYLLLPLKWFGV